ncbi:nuclear protein 96 domain-containing protein [Phthorimaea operculella]|nr:nuclear protein 96 domain-containing protein [Phthorimaea operculella]
MSFEMDTTEDNTESQSLYQDSHRAYGVKSPTSELARLEHRQSHNVQLMKASLYADAEMEDDASVSTEDQMVPHSLVGGSTVSLPLRPPSTQHIQGESLMEPTQTHTHTEEIPMKPLIVRPHTIVLKYHRKVPPFKKTIAGRLNAACIADMSVCRARHSRAGFGPSSAVVYPNARNAVEHLPNSRLNAACIADMSVCRARHSRAGFGPSSAVVYPNARNAVEHLPNTDMSVCRARHSRAGFGPSSAVVYPNARNAVEHLPNTDMSVCRARHSRAGFGPSSAVVYPNARNAVEHLPNTDMSVCRARHSRAGFGPSSAVVYPNARNAVEHLPNNMSVCRARHSRAGFGPSSAVVYPNARNAVEHLPNNMSVCRARHSRAGFGPASAVVYPNARNAVEHLPNRTQWNTCQTVSSYNHCHINIRLVGRLNAACIADMSVCRARHSRAGFGPASAVVYPNARNAVEHLPNNMSVCRARHSRAGFGPSSAVVYPNARNAVEHLPNTAELCDLGRYVSGRDENDWSEQVVVRLALGQPDDKTTFLETLTHHLETLLEFSTFVPDSGEAPRLTLEASPRARREALRRLTKHYSKIPDRKVRFGVSSAYCREVFQLCEALWGADLENDGVPGMDEASIVNRHKKLLEWLTSAVHDVTEAELKKPRAPEPQDESDGHSARVWTLLLGGRVVEACKVAIENGDINMATLIAQCAGKYESDGHSARVWTLLLGGRVVEACKVAIENGDINMATLIAQCAGKYESDGHSARVWTLLLGGRVVEACKVAIENGDINMATLISQCAGKYESDGHSARVWTLLLGGRVVEACKVAIENGDINMATLIAQCAGDPTFRSLIARQISIWRECGADTLISTHRLAALHLLAGLRSPRELLAQTDWLRALHATARFLCPQVPSLEQVVTTYESLFSREETDDGVDLTTVEQDDMGMKLPQPPYLDRFDITVNNGKQRRVLDLRYELIRARAMNSRPKLQPAAYTPDPMDYTLCFLLGTWFASPSADSCVGLADQLEAAGAWHLALQVLQYHPDNMARAHLVRNMLSRGAPSRATSAEQEAQLNLVSKLRIPKKWLLNAQAHRAKYEQEAQLNLVSKLRIPKKWLLNAQAHRAKYERLPALEVEHLIGAEQWNAAHKVLLEELLPEAVLADDLKSIAHLIEQLNSAAQRHEVSGWESGGQAAHHYIHVCQEIRGLVSSAEGGGSVSGRLEALRPRVAAACRALARLSAHTPTHAAARTEMGARLVQLALAAGEPSHHLAILLKTLNLPPDCTAHAQQKITTELAERAADMCIDSPVSSPHSSHHRQAVHS